MSGVCSAGFERTALPAASAALIWPVKMASGKFQGLMQTITPRGAPRLATVLARRGDYAEAEPLQRQALAISEAATLREVQKLVESGVDVNSQNEVNGW